MFNRGRLAGRPLARPAVQPTSLRGGAGPGAVPTCPLPQTALGPLTSFPFLPARRLSARPLAGLASSVAECPRVPAACSSAATLAAAVSTALSTLRMSTPCHMLQTFSLPAHFVWHFLVQTWIRKPVPR